MDRVIVEILGRGGEALARFKCDSFPVRIGRGYDNDIVLTDPFVCPNHLIIRPLDDGLIVEDLCSVNGTFIKGNRVSGPAQIGSGDSVRIGRTEIRFLSPGHALAPTLKLGRPVSALVRWRNVAILCLVEIAVFAFLIFKGYFDIAEKKRFMQMVNEALAYVWIPVFWASIWSLVQWFIKRRGDFVRQLLYGNIFFMGYFICVELDQYANYISSGNTAYWVMSTVVFAGFAAAILAVCFRSAAGMSRRRSWTFASVVVTLVSTLVLLNIYVDSTEFQVSASFSSSLKPPYAKIAPSRSIDEYLGKCGELFDELKKNADKAQEVVQPIVVHPDSSQ